ncbi:MAG: MFS transporter [Pantoea sp.]|uniref:MFS transporter n=1 Tax=Pantoea phytobeneficialis TaxID=2052056 RepID=A0AAP9HBL1_9GAMM|nr:MFS transporter [Pantoea phytobeneficialis]MDO6409647.1 MFS transporter [Pantoea phytobeneficialis]QGR10056.1 MFS transporter [Pantoea phytobeneficialis]
MFNLLGLPKNLLWGYIGLTIFMIGDGVEQAWISIWLVEKGLSVAEASFLITAYGIAVTLAAWVTGVFVQTLGPRKVMLYGLIAFVVGSIGFIGIGLHSMHMAVMLPFYAIRGIGYPLFAYSFLVWINYSTPLERRSTAVGWFWFTFSLGLSVIGPFFSSLALPVMGEIHVLWTGMGFVIVGATLAIWVNRDKVPASEIHPFSAAELMKGITILQRPVIAMGLVVKSINGVAQYGLATFLPLYLISFGYSKTEWLHMWSAVFVVAIFANLFFGFFGDKFGWRNTILWVGGVGYAIVLVLVWLVPQLLGHNFYVMAFVLCLCGVTMAGYVPLSALFPMLAPESKGAAMSVLNLGAGLGAFIAPAITALFYTSLGAGGVLGIYAGLYILSAVLTPFLKTPDELGSQVAMKDKAA